MNILCILSFSFIFQELSGLGNGLGKRPMDSAAYYRRLREVVESRRVISLGISCFHSKQNVPKIHADACDDVAFECAAFDILLFPDCDFEFDGSAKRFLVSHGFDLQQWVGKGKSYSRIDNHAQVAVRFVLIYCFLNEFTNFLFQNDFVNKIIGGLITSRANVVFQNGLTDVAFFYHR